MHPHAALSDHNSKMTFHRLHYLPVALCFLLLATFLTTYVIAVALNHVEPGFPYISYNGNIPPESCIFGQFLNLSAFMQLICIFVRYRQVALHDTVGSRLNVVSTVIGVIGCLGLDMVANFQERNVQVVHFVGAGLCFSGGALYFIMQTIITQRMRLYKLAYVRALFSAICVIGSFSIVIPGGMAMLKFDGDDPMKWQPSDSGYTEHLISAISEWIVSVTFCIYMLTFYNEFKTVSFESPTLQHRKP